MKKLFDFIIIVIPSQIIMFKSEIHNKLAILLRLGDSSTLQLT